MKKNTKKGKFNNFSLASLLAKLIAITHSLKKKVPVHHKPMSLFSHFSRSNSNRHGQDRASASGPWRNAGRHFSEWVGICFNAYCYLPRVGDARRRFFDAFQFSNLSLESNVRNFEFRISNSTINNCIVCCVVCKLLTCLIFFYLHIFKVGVGMEQYPTTAKTHPRNGVFLFSNYKVSFFSYLCHNLTPINKVFSFLSWISGW